MDKIIVEEIKNDCNNNIKQTTWYPCISCGRPNDIEVSYCEECTSDY